MIGTSDKVDLKAAERYAKSAIRHDYYGLLKWDQTYQCMMHVSCPECYSTAIGSIHYMRKVVRGRVYVCHSCWAEW